MLKDTTSGGIAMAVFGHINEFKPDQESLAVYLERVYRAVLCGKQCTGGEEGADVAHGHRECGVQRAPQLVGSRDPQDEDVRRVKWRRCVNITSQNHW